MIDPTDQTPRPLSVPCPLSRCFTAPSFSRALVLCLWLLKIDFFLVYIDSCQQPALSYACRVTVRHKRCCLPGHERSSIHVMYTQVFVHMYVYAHPHKRTHAYTNTHMLCWCLCVHACNEAHRVATVEQAKHDHQIIHVCGVTRLYICARFTCVLWLTSKVGAVA